MSRGIFVSVPAPEIVEMVARSGFDFCVLDGEHGRIGDRDLVPLVASAKAANPLFRVLFRLPELSVAHITHALDSGVDGIVAPQVSSAAEARALVKAAKFHPLGLRGVHPGVRAANFGFRSAADYLSKANSETAVIVQIESKEAFSQLDSILDVEGIDMLFPGPFDLSQSLGIPGQVDHPHVESIMVEIAEKAKLKGIAIGTFAPSPDAAFRYAQMGYSLLAVGGDVFVIGQALQRHAALFKQNLGV